MRRVRRREGALDECAQLREIGFREPTDRGDEDRLDLIIEPRALQRTALEPMDQRRMFVGSYGMSLESR